MDLRIGAVIGIVITAILLAALLPTATSSFYKGQQKGQYIQGYDGNGKAITTDLNVTADTATYSILTLLPLFTVLGGLAIMVMFVKDSFA